MTERTIDLRNQESRTNADLSRPARTYADSSRQARSGAQKRMRAEKTTFSASNKPSQGKKFPLEWVALEYPLRERGPYWYLPPSGVALAFVLFGIVIQSWFFIAFVALALVVVLLSARRPPREYRFGVSPEGILIGSTLHRFAELQSFYIFDTTDRRELSLETGRLLHSYLHLPLGELHPNKVHGVISQYLPEKEHKDFFTDQIARSIGF